MSAKDEGVVITELAELSPEAQVDATALAAILGRSKKTITRAVRRGELPAPTKFLGKHFFLAMPMACKSFPARD